MERHPAPPPTAGGWRTDRVRARLDSLRHADRHLAAFGASHHRYMLGPTLPARDVAVFEQRHGVTVPEAYRTFLLEVGDGGAGPYYGLFRLDGTDAEDFADAVRTPGFLATPFPHTQDWNPNSSRPSPNWMEEEGYFDDRWIAGSMALCHFGCGAVFRLVVTGPGRGQVWLDDRGSDGGISPAAADFRTWYLDWLAEREVAPHGRRNSHRSETRPPLRWAGDRLLVAVRRPAAPHPL